MKHFRKGELFARKLTTKACKDLFICFPPGFQFCFCVSFVAFSMPFNAVALVVGVASLLLFFAYVFSFMFSFFVAVDLAVHDAPLTDFMRCKEISSAKRQM